MSLDPDQVRLSVGPDLGPNCLEISAADDKICHWQAQSLRCTIVQNVQNMKPVQLCTGFLFCTFPSSVTA